MHEVPRIRRFSFEGDSIEADEVESLTDGAEVGFRQRPWWPIRGSIIGGRQPPDAHEVAIRCDQLWQHLGSSVTRSLRDGLEDVDFEDEVEGPDPFLRWLQKVGNNPFDVSIPCKGCLPTPLQWRTDRRQSHANRDPPVRSHPRRVRIRRRAHARRTSFDRAMGSGRDALVLWTKE